MPGDYVTRSEYEQFVKMYEVRHAELRLEMKDLESEIRTQISSVGIKIDTLSTQVSRSAGNAWKLLAVALLNFLLGGGLVAVLNYLHVLVAK